VLGLSSLEELGVPGWTLGPNRRSGEAFALPDDAFAALPRLRRLDLSQNRLTTLPSSLYELKHLEFVDLRHNRLDDTTLRRLLDALPGVRLDLRHVRIPLELKPLPGTVRS
jgi:Leucine-rich repeat (LRR) protein